MSEVSDANKNVIHRLALALQDCLGTAAGMGHNLPEMLREALEELAVSYRSIEALVAHCPSSWEADHVRQLASGAQHQFDEELRAEAAVLGHLFTYDRDLLGSVCGRCSCGWPHTSEPAWTRYVDDMAHVREVVEEHLRVRAAELGHTPVWLPGELSCSCGWPDAVEGGEGLSILDHFRWVITPPPPNPAQRAAELARRYGASPAEEVTA